MTMYIKVTQNTDPDERKKREAIKAQILSLFGATGFTGEEIISLVSEMLIPLEIIARIEKMPDGFTIYMVHEEINKILANQDVVMANKTH